MADARGGRRARRRGGLGRAVHNVVGLWPVAAAPELEHALAVEGLRRAGAWVERLEAAHADWGAPTPDPFASINTPEDLDRARDSLAKAPPDL